MHKPDSRMTIDEVRAYLIYDWKDLSYLLVGNDGEWYLGGLSSYSCCDGWVNLVCVSDKLDTLDQERVRCMQKYGQVDSHIKAMEARKDFQWCVDEIANEARWELRRRNFGHAKRLKSLADCCRPLVDEVWSKEWIEHREMMADCLSRMEP